jgi:hypothetical protein
MPTLSIFRYDGTVRNVVGQAITGANIAVMSQPANTSTQPGTPRIDLYAAPVSNQVVAITTATWLNGQITFQFTATPPADVVVGAYIKANGFTPTGYNGVWQVVTVNGNLVTVATPFTPTVAIPNPGIVSVVGTVNTSALPNPLQSDTLGNFFFYAASGVVTVQIYSVLLTQQLVLADQAIIAGGGSGSVTSVALTMPAEFAVAGSPVTVAGTLAVTKNNQNANTVYAGPNAGPAAAPTFRTLVAADFPVGVGTVTSVAVTCTVPAFMGSAIAGSPITTTGTIGITLTFNNQTANTFLAGPAGGGPGAPAFRAIAAADLPGVLLQSTITSLSSANILALLGTPITLVPAPGAGFVIVPIMIDIVLFAGGAAYTDAGGAVSFNIGSASVALPNNNIFLVTVSPNKRIQTFPWAGATDTAGNPPTDDNGALTISKATNNFAAGNGTAKITVHYLVIATT